MYATHSFRTGLALIQQAIDHVAEHADRGAVQPLQDSIAELSDLIDDLPEAIVDAEYNHCGSCPNYNKNIDLVPYGDRSVIRRDYACEVTDPTECPVVQACGMGKPVAVQVPDFLKKQAS